MHQVGCRDIEMGKITCEEKELLDIYDVLEPESSLEYEILICSLETKILLCEADTYYHLSDIDF